MTPERRAVIEADLNRFLKAKGTDDVRQDLILGYVSGLKANGELGAMASFINQILKDQGWTYKELLPELHQALQHNAATQEGNTA